jgi:hypothetical protein
MPIPTHDQVLKLFPKAAAILPRANYVTLSGNGLDKDLLVRQTVGGDEQWLYVINPCWWAEGVELKLEESTGRNISDPVWQAKVAPHRTKEGLTIALRLEGWSIKVLKIQPPTGVLGATVHPDAAALRAIETTMRDIDAMLPYLATRRPNLVPNGDFEQVDTKGILVGWKLYGWHLAEAECTTEAKETPTPSRYLRIDNSKRGDTVGLFSPQFAVAPGREYTFLARMAADRASVRARLALVGEKYVGQKFALDTSWREVSFVWPAAQSATLSVGARMRAEIHNDGRGVLFVDDVRLVDSTFVNYADSAATEQAVTDAQKARDQGSLYQTFIALSNPRITKLLDTLRRRRAGNEWLLLGPFDSAAGGLDGAYPPETHFLKGADLSSTTYVGKDKRQVKGISDWTIKNAGAPDYIDLAASVGPFDHSEAFAFTNVYSEANRKALFLVGSDDGVKVWLNGAVVFTKAGERAAKPGEFSVPVTLRRGWNRVLVKVENIEKDWGFFFTLADEGGKRLAGAKYCVRLSNP